MAIWATLVYFFVSGTMLIAVAFLLMAAMCGIMIGLQVLQEIDGGTKEKRWRYFLICMGIFLLVNAVVRLVLFPESATFVWRW